MHSVINQRCAVRGPGLQSIVIMLSAKSHQIYWIDIHRQQDIFWQADTLEQMG